MSNTAAQSDCTDSGLSGLATVEQDEQYEALKGFVNVLLKEDEQLWLGYYYDAGGNVLLRGTGVVTDSAVSIDQNFMSNGVNPGDGVCIAIGRDGLFRRTVCTMTLPYACYKEQGQM